MTARSRVAAALVAAFAALFIVIPASPAAAQGSSIVFVTASPVQAAYGGNWFAQLQTQLEGPDGTPVPADQASVTVRIAGVEAPLATGLPIQPDGVVYVSAPAAAPLAPGSYQLTAEIVPVASSYITGSQTTTPLTLEVTSFALTASASVDQASVDADQTPVIELALSGEYVDSTDAVPSGTWSIVVKDGSDVVVETEVAQPGGDPEPVRYPIDEDLERGREFTVESEFTPVESVAAGLDLTQPSTVTFRTRSDSFIDLLGSAVPYPLWLMVLTALIPLGLAIAVIVLTTRLGRSAAVAAGAEPVAAPVEPARPVEPAEPAWDPFASAGPADPSPTQVLPPGGVLPPTEVLPREPGAFTQLITPPQPAAPQDAPTENWTLSQEDPDDPDSQHLR